MAMPMTPAAFSPALAGTQRKAELGRVSVWAPQTARSAKAYEAMSNSRSSIL